MPELPLAGKRALVLGAERPAGRRIAVALAEAGADVAVVTLSEDTKAEFAVNSAANEFWALGRKGIALTSDGRETTVQEAIADATHELGPIAVYVHHSPSPVAREALAGLRSDPAIVVVIGDDDTPEHVRALLEWTRDLAAAGLRANALLPSRAVADAAGPLVKEHQPPEAPLGLDAAALYLASDASAAVEGAIVVVGE